MPGFANTGQRRAHHLVRGRGLTAFELRRYAQVDFRLAEMIQQAELRIGRNRPHAATFAPAFGGGFCGSVATPGCVNSRRVWRSFSRNTA